ncbi:MAG: ABC transporter permease [Dehalococcoidia bacterium]
MDSVWTQLVSLDSETWSAAGRSLWFAATSCVISVLICFPLGSLIHFRQFRGKGLLVSVLQSLYCMPTVLVGLLVFSLLSRAGPMGDLGWLFSPKAIIFGQVVLISPIMMGLVISAYSGVDRSVTETAISLGASRIQMIIVAVREAKYAMITLVIIGFSRAISELGISMMVGGNINFYTRTLTTATSLATQKGEIEKAWAMGILLLLIALIINIAIYSLQKSGRLRKLNLFKRILAGHQPRSG